MTRTRFISPLCTPNRRRANHAWEQIVHEPFETDAARKARIQQHAERVLAESRKAGQPVCSRGAKRPVVCLTKRDDAGRLMRYDSVSEAAADIGQKCDHVVQAIKRYKQSDWMVGSCCGHVYAYADDLPPNPEHVRPIEQPKPRLMLDDVLDWLAMLGSNSATRGRAA